MILDIIQFSICVFMQWAAIHNLVRNKNMPAEVVSVHIIILIVFFCLGTVQINEIAMKLSAR